MQAPALAVKELRRCITELGLAGIQIGSHISGPDCDSITNGS
jgi:aminocarboxymuconate-semialdehyde decarboxylase